MVVLHGCLAPVHPRPAEVAEPGRFSWDLHLPIGPVGFGELRADVRGPEPGDPVEARTLDGPSFGMYDVTSSGGAGVPPVWWELSGKYGLFSGCEVGVMVGIFRQGGELRCAVLTGNRPFAMTVSAGAAYQPFFGLGGPWYRAGLDASRDLAGVRLLAGVYASRGREARDFGGSVPVELWDPPLDETVSHDPGPRLGVVRREIRVAVPLGVGIRATPRYTVILGVTPHFVVRSGDIREAECERCPRVTVVGLDERIGVTLTVGVAFAGQKIP